MVIHVMSRSRSAIRSAPSSDGAACALGPMCRRQSDRCTRGQARPIVRDLLPHHAPCRLILEGIPAIPFKGNVPMVVAAASLMVIAYLALEPCCSSWCATCRPRLGSLASLSRRHSVLLGSDPDPRHERVFARLERDPAVALVYGGIARAGGARGCRCRNPRACSRRWRD